MSENTIEVYTEGGRCCQPLFILDEQHRLRFDKNVIKLIKHNLINWNHLLNPKLNILDNFSKLTLQFIEKHKPKKSIVEFVDVQELNTLMIAPDFKKLLDNYTIKTSRKGTYFNYTHMGIHPSLIRVYQFHYSIDHNQSPRNTYQAAGKQAMNLYNKFQKQIRYFITYSTLS